MWFLTLILIMVPLNIAEYHNPFSQDAIDVINMRARTWKAGRNFDPSISTGSAMHLMGELPSEAAAEIPVKLHGFRERMKPIPETFDARNYWPNCSTIGEIVDQGSCGSCWAVAATQAISDRICIHSKGQKIVHISAIDAVSCCVTCGRGCVSGSSRSAWLYWTTDGIVTGGNYNSNEGCRPYTHPPCQHTSHDNSTLPQCFASDETPSCNHHCREGHDFEYDADKYYGKNSYAVLVEAAEIQREILENGPLTAAMTVYDDLFYYKQGVYIHVYGIYVGRHAIKIIGWGSMDGIPYWLVVNSWNSDWGDNGLFKILRGENHCRIEDHVTAGIPRKI